jgi:Glycosyl transferase family 2
MATLPYFVISPSTFLSLGGLFHGPDTTTPTPAENWREARVDVIIPALNEADHIVLCLASLLRQTMRPRRIVLIDDGSKDRTVEIAKEFCAFHQIALTAIKRRAPIGKTPTLKRQSRELDSDVEFILDADTVLESDNYIERAVQELYKGVGIASSFGMVLPQRKSDRQQTEALPEVRAFVDQQPVAERETRPQGWWHHFARGITNMYRDALYAYLQCFIYRGQMVFFGTTSNPVGCAVAYRRKYVQAMFDHVGPTLGDDLTNSEDIFIGFSMLNEGYRNVQITDVHARTVEPEVQRLPRQIYHWSSSFLQSCYYFDQLLRSPFKALKRWRARHSGRQSGGSLRQAIASRPTPTLTSPRPSTFAMAAAGPMPGPSGVSIQNLQPFGTMTPSRSETLQSGPGTHVKSSSDRRIIGEPYRQAFGRERTEVFGRPAGWILLMSAMEKIFFPTTLIILLILRNWHGLAWTVVIETAMCAAALALAMKGRRIEYALKGLAVTPVRYSLLAMEAFTIARFASDLWITKNRRWRK